MDDREREAWDSVVGNLSQCILGDDDFKVRVISGWLDVIRGADLKCDSVFLTRLFLRDRSGNLVNEDVVVGDGGVVSGDDESVVVVGGVFDVGDVVVDVGGVVDVGDGGGIYEKILKVTRGQNITYTVGRGGEGGVVDEMS